MGANEKFDAAMHGGEHYFGSADPVSANRVRFMSESELDRFIAKIRADAKAEALEEAASEIDRLDSCVEMYDENLNARQVSHWLRARANQYKETPDA